MPNQNAILLCCVLGKGLGSLSLVTISQRRLSRRRPGFGPILPTTVPVFTVVISQFQIAEFCFTDSGHQRAQPAEVDASSIVNKSAQIAAAWAPDAESTIVC